jgi:hypothetical protein
LPNSDGGLLVRHPDEAERRVKRDDKAIDIGGREVAPHPEVLKVWPQGKERGKIGLSRLTGVN